MPTTKFFRIATEGDTTDGRVIERSWLEQMAASYDRAKFSARIWLEHIRGILPDSPFNAYGDVIALKAEEVMLDGQKKMALFAQLDATPGLVAMNKARQKLFTSMEVDPNFAKTGKAYLTGLAVTDSPASLGTEMLAFSAGAQTNPLASRKQNPENLFTAAQEVEIEFEQEESAGASLFAKVKSLLAGKSKDDDSRFADVGQAVEAVADSQKGLLDKFSGLETTLQGIAGSITQLSDAQAADRKSFTELKATLDAEPAGHEKRPAATGGNGDGKNTTDC